MKIGSPQAMACGLPTGPQDDDEQEPQCDECGSPEVKQYGEHWHCPDCGLIQGSKAIVYPAPLTDEQRKNFHDILFEIVSFCEEAK